MPAFLVLAWELIAWLVPLQDARAVLRDILEILVQLVLVGSIWILIME